MKKPEKKKTGKKKTAAKDSNKLGSKELQREFNKRMKTLVRDIKKETQITIKNVLKEAKRKLNEGSEFVMNDVLNSIVTTVEGAEAAITGKKEPKSGKKDKKKKESQPATAPAENNISFNEDESSIIANTEAEAIVPVPTRSSRSSSASKENTDAPVVAKKPATTRSRKVALAPAPTTPEESVAEASQ